MSSRNKTLLALLLLAYPRAQLHASDPTPCGSELSTLNYGQLTLAVRPNNISQNSDFGVAIANAAAKWTNSRANVTLGLSWSNGAEPALGNGVSEVYFVDNLEHPAATFLWSTPPSCITVEADVLFADYHPWAASDDPDDVSAYNGPNTHFEAVAIHEFGHAIGLDHRHDVYNVMGDANTHLHRNNEIVTAYPGEWGVTRAVEIYGQDPGTYEDLGVAHWRRSGSYGHYSLHSRTRLESKDDASIATLFDADQKYEVEIGQKLAVEMTLENFGKHEQEVRIGYYLSSNSNLSTQDRFLGSHVRTIVPNVPATIKSPTLTLPSDLVPEKDYWIGAIVDDDQQLPEVAEWNNRASIAIQTRALPENLVAAAVGGPNLDKAGTTAIVTSSFSNLGGGAIAAFSYEIRLSKNTTITSNDRLVATIFSTNLGFHLDEVTIPADLLAGDYYWGIVALPSSEEVDLSDNKKAGNKVTITKGDPDMVAVSIGGAATFEVGDSVKFNVEIDNIGGISAGLIEYRIVLSEDTDIELSDHVVKLGSMVKAGKKSVTVTIPDLPATGAYRLGLIVSKKGSETNLANNSVIGPTVLVTSVEGGGGGDLSSK